MADSEKQADIEAIDRIIELLEAKEAMNTALKEDEHYVETLLKENTKGGFQKVKEYFERLLASIEGKMG